MRTSLMVGLIVTAATASRAVAPAPPAARADSAPAQRLVVFEEFSRPT